MTPPRADVAVDEALALDHGLTKEEYAHILEHLGRVPTFEELGIFSVMWSEHCSYKSSRVHLRRLPSDGPRVLQGPGENAGAIDIGGGMAVVFKIESHNHPSFIEPYQGAATGVGGILRDVFTMGARPVANLDVLYFGDPEHEKTAYLLGGVVGGIGGYGNCVGVPTVGGQTVFDEAYNGNILVNALTAGIVSHDRIFRARAAGEGNPVLYVGSKTGRDGIHGASLLASSEFKEESEQMKPTVQVGDPFSENLLIEACLEIMAGDDVVAIQDMGAAGLTSSSVEMAGRGGVGVELDLDRIPLRDETLTPYEMLLSESQERMVIVARKGRAQSIKQICAKWGLDCVEVGRVTADGRFTALYRGARVVSIPVAALTDAAPAYQRPLAAPPVAVGQPLDRRALAEPTDLGAVLVNLIGSANLCSREWIYRQYDFYVGADTVVAPGGDAAVLRVKQTGAGIALTADCNSRYVTLDPYLGTQHAVAEAARNLAAVGARPLGVSDCLNFGNPEKPEVMWQFSRAVDGMAEACRIFEAPVVSGNVSFYNDNQGASIPPTPVVAMVGLVSDCCRVATIGFRSDGENLLLLGYGRPQLEASEYIVQRGGPRGDAPPRLDLSAERKLCDCCVELVERGLLRTAHDISEGGIAVALAEMFLAGDGPGCSVELAPCRRADEELFGQGAGRIVAGVSDGALAEVEATAKERGVPLAVLGRTGGDRLRISISGRGNVIDFSREQLAAPWRDALERVAQVRRSAA